MKEKIKNLFSKLKSKKVNLKNLNSNKSPSLINIFSPSSRKAAHKFFLIIAITSSSYLIGKTGGLFLKDKFWPTKKVALPKIGPMKTSNLRNDINTIKLANLFNAKVNTEDANTSQAKTKKKPKVDINNIKCAKADIKSVLPITLTNTIVLQDRIKSVASVQIRNKKIPLSLREGQKIENLASISKITRLSIILKNLKTGTCEFVENKSVPKRKTKKYAILSPREGKKLLSKKVNDSITNIGDKFKIKKSFRSKMLSDIGSILTQAKAIRMDNPDGTMCFKMTEVVSGSLYSQLDIQNEDIICGINGKKIRSLTEMMTLFSQMNQIDHFQLTRKRNGENKNIEYNFED